jgi:cytochrome c-type biogenesis protein CcmH
MMWLLLALLAEAAVVPVILALRRAHTRPAGNGERFSIYRDQLAQLPDEINRGVIEAGQGPAARLEIERRMLETALSEEAAKDAKPVAEEPMRGRTAATLAAALSGGAFALYLALGSPSISAAGGRVPIAAG